MKVTVLTEERKVVFEAERGSSLGRLFSMHAIAVPMRCGGNGTCGKCRVRILEGRVSGAQPDAQGFVLACRAYPESDCVVAVSEEHGRGLEGFRFMRKPEPSFHGWGVAFDLGTTTLAACLVRLDDASVVSRISRLNPQAVFGSDVISRIGACAERANLEKQHELILSAAAEMVRALSRGAGGVHISRMTVAGNTTMLHLFCGEDPSSIGVYPFTPKFLSERTYSGEDLGIPADRVIVLASVSSYVGADITADMLAADFLRGSGSVLLADLGTNGEMALRSNGRILCTSAAAGPALEGACISCGVGGIDGAVDRVWLEDGALRFSTIGGAPAKGICGCGLIDLIACLLRRGDIDETGYLAADKVYLTPQVWLSREDIRQYQLAKAAVCAAMRTLLARAGEKAPRLLIAGGLGFYIDAANAALTGLIPPDLAPRAEAVGNGSLYGACLALTDETCRAESERIAAQSETVDLTSDPDFNERFIDGMMFE